MIFANKEYFFLLLLLIPYVWWYCFSRRKKTPTLKVSTTEVYRYAPHTWKMSLVHVPFALRIITFILIILVLARPQTSNSWKNSETEGIDMMLATDVSTSMLAEDLHPNRVDAAKQVATEFISNRPTDNIGLTIFAGEAFTQCPMTVDHNVLLNMFRNVSCDLPASGMIDDGTAIGMGIANAVARLKTGKSKSKVLILLTDGANNRGDISPLTAADIAKQFGIRIYTIAVGRDGTAPYPMPVPGGGVHYVNMPSDVDFATLKQIADNTGGIAYRAGTNQKLKQIYNDIDKLEKTKLEVKRFDKHYDAYQLFGFAALLTLLLEILLRITVLRKIP